MDIILAEQEINSLKSAFEDMKTNIMEEHSQLHQSAVDLAHNLGIEPSMPRIVQTQRFRDNCPADTPEDYYRVNLTTVFFWPM